MSTSFESAVTLPPLVASYEGRPGEIKKCLLCYSGGLDSSVMIPWIKEVYGCDVAAYTADIGQFEDEAEIQAVAEKAAKIGAVEVHVVDLKDEYANTILAQAIKANCDYQGGYHLSTPLARVITAAWAVKIAKEHGCDAIAHGCTGKGNDQVRFDAYIQTLAPDIKVIAPVRHWSMGREEEYAYAKSRGVPVTETGKRAVYSHDDNVWGYTAEGGAIEDPALVPPYEEFLRLSRPIEQTPDTMQTVTVGFEQGVPVSLDGLPMALPELLTALNAVGGKHGVGVTTLIEDRIVGLKVRGVYEAPAAAILINAHRNIEKLVLTRDVLEFKASVDQKWSFNVYDAKWFSPLQSALNAFIDDASMRVTGTVTVTLFKGHLNVVAASSPYALFSASASAFEVGTGFNTLASAPFIEHYGYAIKVYNAVGQAGPNTEKPPAPDAHTADAPALVVT